ncbi:hypothetical protein DFQ05_0365 [Winogradskyella wandonensis]|uniref:SpoIIAA-like protein n=1 Tax=Winogradskyella wandonensis TaxID=1442586 RepID=A0A4R1KUH7_9FLAO|nr:hypothetical protein [Winogradskyella wandonensis]TCK68855.1 hypothetical protein DFQ05_0365 [Winogradskyella wandonensis]
MITVKSSVFSSKILKELSYDFGDVYIFDGFVVSEINSGVTITWDDHAKQIVDDVTSFLNTDGSDLVYISNRINSYAVKPNDWLKFFTNSYSLKGYGVVANTKGSIMNTVIENLFFNKKIQRFNSLEAAVQWAKDRVLVDI